MVMDKLLSCLVREGMYGVWLYQDCTRYGTRYICQERYKRAYTFLPGCLPYPCPCPKKEFLFFAGRGRENGCSRGIFRFMGGR